MPAAKQLWILAGGNGAGKSTFYNLYLTKNNIKFVNADLIAKEIDFIAQAKAHGYKVILMYFHLNNSALHEARVITGR